MGFKARRRRAPAPCSSCGRVPCVMEVYEQGAMRAAFEAHGYELRKKPPRAEHLRGYRKREWPEPGQSKRYECPEAMDDVRRIRAAASRAAERRGRSFTVRASCEASGGKEQWSCIVTDVGARVDGARTRG